MPVSFFRSASDSPQGSGRQSRGEHERSISSYVARYVATFATRGNESRALAQSDAGLEEITVTAQKREESLMNVPIAVSVTTAEQISRDQIYTLGDLQRTTPALEVSQTFGGEVSGGGRIRGIGTAIQNNAVRCLCRNRR